jgi:hypothetical protein
MDLQPNGKLVRQKQVPRRDELMPIIEVMWQAGIRFVQCILKEKLQSVMGEKPLILFTVYNMEGTECGNCVVTRPTNSDIHW